MRVVSIWIIPSTTWRYRQVVEGYILFSSQWDLVNWVENKYSKEEDCLKCIATIYRPTHIIWPQLVKLTLCSPDSGDASFFLPGDPSQAREAWQAKMGTCLPPTVVWPQHKSCPEETFVKESKSSSSQSLSCERFYTD